MRAVLAFLVITLLSSLAHAEFEKIRTITDPVVGPLRQTEAIDVGVSLQYGRSNKRNTGNVQFRVGYLHLREPLIFTVSPLIQFSTRLPTSYGGEVELTHFWSGLRGRLGAITSDGHRVSYIAGVGFSCLGVEAQTNRDNSLSVFGTLDIPVGILIMAAYN